MSWLWLALFKAKTEEELAKIEEMGVEVMREAVEAYQQVSASPEYQEMERMRSKAGHDEAQALKNAETRGEERSDKKWQKVVADKDIALADKDMENKTLRKQLAELQAKIGK